MPAPPPFEDLFDSHDTTVPPAAQSGGDTVYTVSSLTRKVRRTLEEAVGQVKVEGEIGNLRRQASGHQYFTLKDDASQLSCVLFRGNSRFVHTELEEGLLVIAGGDLTVYEARGQYQLVVRTVTAAGQGALQARFEALKRRLHAEGLFDERHKRPLPPFPSVIGLVTSPSGAAVRDILNILGRRAPWIRVLVHPTRVQGSGAAEEIAAAIEVLDRAEAWGLPRPDVIIAGRGGGSLEDLWCFNEEVVARAIHACRTPIISAVGHEIDFTIADLVADLRAPTPSAAAELVAPDRAELRHRLDHLGNALLRRVTTTLTHQRRILALLATGTLQREPARLLRDHAQTVDSLAAQLDQQAHSALARAEDRRDRLARLLALHRPDRTLRLRSERLDRVRSELDRGMRVRLARHREKAAHLDALLRNLGPARTFARGFSMTLGPDGRPLANADDVAAGDRIRTRLAHGCLESEVTRTGTADDELDRRPADR